MARLRFDSALAHRLDFLHFDSVSNDLGKAPSFKRAVLVQTAGGYITSAIQAAQALLLVPLCLAVLGDRLYGFWLASGGVLAWLGMVDIGAGAVMVQRCAAAYAQGDLVQVGRYFRHGLLVTAVLAGLLLVLVISIGFSVPGWLVADAVYRRELGLAFVLSGGAVAMSFVGGFFRDFSVALQRNTAPVIVVIASDLASLAVSVGGLLGGAGIWSLVGAFLARGLIILFGCGFYTLRLKRSMGPTAGWSRAIFRDYLTTTPWTLLAKSSGQLVLQLPQVLLTRMIGPGATVAYVVTARAASMMDQFCGQIIASSYGPLSHLMHSGDSVKTRRTLHLLTGVLMAVALLGATGYLVAVRGFVSLWTKPGLFLGMPAAVAFSLGILTGAWNRWSMIVVFASGRIMKGSLMSFAETALRGLGVLFGVLWGGPVGTVIGLALAGLLFAPVSLFNVRMVGTSWLAYGEVLRCLVLPTIALGAALVLSPYFPGSSWLAWIGGATGWVSLFAIGLVIFSPEIRIRSGLYIAGLANRGRRLIRRKQVAGDPRP